MDILNRERLEAHYQKILEENRETILKGGVGDDHLVHPQRDPATAPESHEGAGSLTGRAIRNLLGTCHSRKNSGAADLPGTLFKPDRRPQALWRDGGLLL